MLRKSARSLVRDFLIVDQTLAFFAQRNAEHVFKVMIYIDIFFDVF